MLINCDIGERGLKHPIDDQLMRYIDIANIACGGHAGDKSTIAHYAQMAEEYAVIATAHLSYPDKINFGRHKMAISYVNLLESLEEQYSLFPVGRVKFHGALYHEANNNPELAELLLEFVLQHKITTLILPEFSLMIYKNINILYEGFIERGYQYSNKKLDLIPRGQPGDVIKDIPNALIQYKQLCNQNIIIQNIEHPLRVDTICIHSDSDIALELAKSIRNQSKSDE